MRRRNTSHVAFGAAASVAAVVTISACGDGGAGQRSEAPATSPTPPASAPASAAAAYEDGSYTVRGVYGGAPSYITVTLSLDEGTVSQVDVGLMPDNNATSRGFQERFATAVPAEVVGRNIADLDVDVIAGASGCSDGFNDALDKIRERAQRAGSAPAEDGNA